MDRERWSPDHHSLWENPLKAQRGWGNKSCECSVTSLRGSIHCFTPWLLCDVRAWLTLLECEGRSSGLHPHWVPRVNPDRVGEKQKARKNLHWCKWLLAVSWKLPCVWFCCVFLLSFRNYLELSGQGEMWVGKKWGWVDINKNYWNANSLLEIKWYCFVEQQDNNNENHILHSGEFSWN